MIKTKNDFYQVLANQCINSFYCTISNEKCPLHGICKLVTADDWREFIENLEDDKMKQPIAIPDSPVEMTIKHLREENKQLSAMVSWLAERCAMACLNKATECAFFPQWHEIKTKYNNKKCQKSFCELSKDEWIEIARKATEIK